MRQRETIELSNDQAKSETALYWEQLSRQADLLLEVLLDIRELIKGGSGK